MAQLKMDCVQEKGRIGFHTETGFTLMRGLCSVTTNRGQSQPQTNGKPKLGIEHELHVKRLSGKAVEFWQSVRNLRDETLRLSEIKAFDGRLTCEGAGWRVAHNQLYKREYYFGNYGARTDGLFAPLPEIECELGLSEDFPFPGIFFTHPERGTILMAVLSQDRCKPVWNLRRDGRGSLLTAVEHFSGIPSIPVKGGHELASERWVMIGVKGALEDAVEEYYKILRKRIDFVGKDSILRQAVLWGTWNYNRRERSFCDITHDMVVANARALAKLVPNKPCFVMIDDGYQRGKSQELPTTNIASSLEIFHDDGTPPHDPKLFPRGMKYTAQEIRKAGALPAIWATPRIRSSCALAKAHPELLLELSGNKSFGARSRFLDYSLPEVREYTRQAWDTIFNDWGYQAMKLDFWTMPWEVPHLKYKRKDKTAIELRNLFLKDVREFVPDDGYLLVAVVTNSGGNPFPGRYADAVRMGADVSDGAFHVVRDSAFGLTVAAPFYRHDCFLGDPDSLGWCPDNTPGQNRLWATMAMLSGPLCEIAGDLTKQTPEARDLLRTAIDLHGPCIRTSTDLSAGGIDNMPACHMTMDTEDGVYEAWLNWTSSQRDVRLIGTVRDLWTGQKLKGTHTIPPYDAILFKRGKAAQ